MKRLLYRVVPYNGGVVFAEPDRATLIAKIHSAINSSKTWGQFRSAMPRDEYSKIVRTHFDDNGEPRPKSTDPFSSDFVPGWSDGDYPPWLQQEVGRILPRDVLLRFGEHCTSVLNGGFWLIPEERLRDICDALRARGWELDCAQHLECH